MGVTESPCKFLMRLRYTEHFQRVSEVFLGRFRVALLEVSPPFLPSNILKPSETSQKPPVASLDHAEIPLKHPYTSSTPLRPLYFSGNSPKPM